MKGLINVIVIFALIWVVWMTKEWLTRNKNK